MKKETHRIARQLEKEFDKQPWYGPSMMTVLSEVKQGNSGRRNGKAHSIIELILHMTSWRTFVTKRLSGDNDFEVSAKMNFPKPGTLKAAMKGLKKSQELLLKAIRDFPDERLNELVPSKRQKYTYYTLMHGIIQHDVYHLGQIVYIMSASRGKRLS